MKFRFFRFMDGTPGAAGGGDAGAGAAAGGAGAAGAAAGQPGAAAGAGAGAGAGAAAEGGGGSALSAGAAGEWTIESIPEKFRVKNDAGEYDHQAMLRKVDEHRSALEKRMGTGDIRPKTAAEYKMPEGEAFKALQIDEAQATAFKEKAHGWGLTQTQYEAVMNEWATLAPGLVNAGQQQTTESAVAALKEAWKGDYDANIKESYAAAVRVGQAAGFTFEEVEQAIGNNPVAIRMFGALAKEMREDATPAAANGGTNSPQSREAYVAANWKAYSDPTHPEHKVVTEHANRLSQREAARAPQT